jgi:hypothetical protein
MKPISAGLIHELRVGSQRAGVRLWLPSFLIGLFKRLKERVNGLKLGCKKCLALSGVGKALF